MATDTLVIKKGKLEFLAEDPHTDYVQFKIRVLGVNVALPLEKVMSLITFLEQALQRDPRGR